MCGILKLSGSQHHKIPEEHIDSFLNQLHLHVCVSPLCVSCVCLTVSAFPISRSQHNNPGFTVMTWHMATLSLENRHKGRQWCQVLLPWWLLVWPNSTTDLGASVHWSGWATENTSLGACFSAENPLSGMFSSSSPFTKNLILS